MARFFRSTEQPFISQFIPENLALKQDYYDRLQKRQDTMQGGIDSIKIDANPLPNDIPSVIEAKKQAKDSYESLRNINWNDPNESKKGLQSVSQIRNQMDSLTGSIGVANKKAAEYYKEKELIDKDREKNPVKASYRMSQLEQNAKDPNMSIQWDSKTNSFKNTQITVPKDFDYVQVGDWAMKLANEVTPEQVIKNSGLSDVQGREAMYSYYNGTDKYRVGDTIRKTIIEAAGANPNVVESLNAESHQFGDTPVNRLQHAIEMAVAAKSAHEKTGTIHYDTDNTKLFDYKQNVINKPVEPNQIETYFGNQQLNDQQLLTQTGLEGINIDSKGNIIPPMKSAYPLQGKFKQGQAEEFASMYEDPTLSGIDKEQLNVWNKKIEDIKKLHPVLKNMNPGEIISTIKKLKSDMSLLHNLAYNTPNLDPKLIKENILNNIDGKAFKVQGDEITGFTGIDNVAEKLGISGDQFRKELKESTAGNISPANGGSYELQLFDKNGQPQTIYVKGSNEMISHFKPAEIISNREKSLSDGTYQVDSNTEADTRIVQDENGNIKLNTIVYPISSKEETSQFIKDSGKTKENLTLEGYSFNDDGRLILKGKAKTPDLYYKDLVSSWISSGKEDKNKKTIHKLDEESK